MTDLRDFRDPPWGRSDWRGNLVSIDGCATDDFVLEDVIRVVAYADTGRGWDGTAVGCVELSDGRFAAWSTTWDATGSGFVRDAYGGFADIGFARNEEAAIDWLSEKDRELLGEDW